MKVRRITQRLRRLAVVGRNAALGKLAIVMIKIVRHFDPDRSIEFAARWMRRIGPWLPEHRVGRDNLAAAFPEKSEAERAAILSEVWANLGRIGAEFAHLDRIWDYDAEQPHLSRIEINRKDLETFGRVRDSGRPALAFSAHIGNWELPALAAAANGMGGAVLYRAPNIREIDRYVREIRAPIMGMLVPSTFDAPLRLGNLLQEGVSVGLLVDQYYSGGVEVTFFGRTCKANPLIARLARQVECPIYGVHITRLPGNRFRSEMTDPIEPARDAEGRIDIAGTMQIITSMVEGWVRAHPEQWLWLHRRWR